MPELNKRDSLGGRWALLLGAAQIPTPGRGRAMGTPTHDELCRVAYGFWQERGCPDGSPEVDWQRAEEELGLKEVESYASASSSGAGQ